MADVANHHCDLQQICSQRHWSIYWIFIFCSVAILTGRVLTINEFADPADSPFFSANDRSRWCTIRSLGDHGTYEIDRVISNRNNRFSWDTIDKVKHFGRDGQLHSYSSKPTLLPTILAGQYRVIKRLTGKNLADDTTFIVRVMLLLTNVIPWGIYLWLLAKLLELIPTRDWARYFCVACAGFGTYLSTFGITLNNHLPAAVCVMATLYALTRIMMGNRSWFFFAFAGAAAAFATANELPALAFFCCATLLCAWKSWPKTCVAFVPAAAVVAVGFFVTNFQAHGDWRPPYAHRGDGAVFATVEGNYAAILDSGLLPDEMINQLPGRFELLQFEFPVISVEPAMWPGWDAKNGASRRWIATDLNQKRFTIVASENKDVWNLCHWDNWYDYPGSYWLTSNDKNKSAVDLGQSSVTVYAYHLLFGHHGIFSLTPIWILSLAGMVSLLFLGRFQLRWFALVTMAVSVVVIGFYIARPEHDRNYGGFTSALRWAFWLAPMWLVSILPIAEWLGKTGVGRMICYVLLGVSAISAAYAASNPWVQPWLYELWDYTSLPK